MEKVAVVAADQAVSGAQVKVVAESAAEAVATGHVCRSTPHCTKEAWEACNCTSS
jgi:hypothetical protein